MAARLMPACGELDIATDPCRDMQPLWGLVEAVLEDCGASVHCLRATRPGAGWPRC